MMGLASAAAPIAVKSATGVLTATGVWSAVAVITVAIIGAVVAYIRIMPRLRELESADKAGLRREFIEEMAALRTEATALRNEVSSLREQVRLRDDKIDLMRREIGELHNVIDGMRRENQAAQISGQRVIRDHLEALPQSGKAK